MYLHLIKLAIEEFIDSMAFFSHQSIIDRIRTSTRYTLRLVEDERYRWTNPFARPVRFDIECSDIPWSRPDGICHSDATFFSLETLDWACEGCCSDRELTYMLTGSLDPVPDDLSPVMALDS